MKLLAYYKNLLNEGAWITELNFPTIFKDNPEYEDFIIKTTGMDAAGSNYMSWAYRLIDTAGTEISSSDYYYMSDNMVGTYRAVSSVLAKDNQGTSTLGTQRARSNACTFHHIRKPMTTGVKTTWQLHGGGQYAATASTTANGGMQFISGEGYLNNTTQVGGIVFVNRYSAWSQQYAMWGKIEVFGIDKI